MSTTATAEQGFNSAIRQLENAKHLFIINDCEREVYKLEVESLKAQLAEANQRAERLSDNLSTMERDRDHWQMKAGAALSAGVLPEGAVVHVIDCDREVRAGDTFLDALGNVRYSDHSKSGSKWIGLPRKILKRWHPPKAESGEGDAANDEKITRAIFHGTLERIRPDGISDEHWTKRSAGEKVDIVADYISGLEQAAERQTIAMAYKSTREQSAPKAPAASEEPHGMNPDYDAAWDKFCAAIKRWLPNTQIAISVRRAIYEEIRQHIPAAPPAAEVGGEQRDEQMLADALAFADLKANVHDVCEWLHTNTGGEIRTHLNGPYDIQHLELAVGMLVGMLTRQKASQPPVTAKAPAASEEQRLCQTKEARAAERIVSWLSCQSLHGKPIIPTEYSVDLATREPFEEAIAEIIRVAFQQPPAPPAASEERAARFKSRDADIRNALDEAALTAGWVPMPAAPPAASNWEAEFDKRFISDANQGMKKFIREFVLPSAPPAAEVGGGQYAAWVDTIAALAYGWPEGSRNAYTIAGLVANVRRLRVMAYGPESQPPVTAKGTGEQD